MIEKPHIVIAGAGILGLTTAWVIAENLSASNTPYEITIVAEYGPHSPTMHANLTNSAKYTSPWAGAHFRPFPSKNEQELKEMKLTRLTLQKFKQLSQTSPESSIKFVKGIEYLENPDEHYSKFAYGWSEEIDNFKHKTDKPGFLGVEYDTWVVNSPMYLQFLYRKLSIEYSNINFLKIRLDSLKQINDLFPKTKSRTAPIIINCTGNGLQYNGGFDPECYPIRGQTLLIKPPPSPQKNGTNQKCQYLDKTITYQLKDGSWSFVIPRPFNGGVILGGMKQIGLRLDVEQYDNKQYVINNYGAGGMGYELSYGAAIKVYEKLMEILGRRHHL
ncbi:hypothetical protein CAWG_03470 [Candida albicans WO-1]|uniref:FAD dependent oxidoreductase domain-containing protein n=1 Tax=Candida albicans (strain WO-1) TaxID=294748 RepID=C4YHC4_CANAW|nr:hypothetical protein CAWG_03470 [Candida albicans WO-1]